jgi:AraC-like DNA-binding protein
LIKFYDILVSGSVFTSFIASVLLFTRGKYQPYANRLLGVVIFTWGWYALLYLLVITGWLRYMPGIYRVGSPLYYLIPACSYLYTRSVLLEETRFRKYDWLHFLPAIINIIDLLPFYFSDSETKRVIVNSIVNNFNDSYQKGSGLIPAFWHFQFRWILGVVYLVFQWLLLYRVVLRDKIKGHKVVSDWLFIFTIFLSVIYVGLGTMSVIAWINLGNRINPLSSARSIPTLLQVMGFTCLSVYLFFKPEVLYGIPGVPAAPSVKEKLTETDREAPFNLELMDLYVEQLEIYINEEEPFKRHGFTVTELAQALKIPLHHLSYVLNHYYKQRFTDFINNYRVNYIKKQLESDSWRSYTLEALAKESGFSSRSTFSVAFKKFTGLSPSQYLQLNENAKV